MQKTSLFQQYDGRTLLDINDGGYVAIANGATGPGQLKTYTKIQITWYKLLLHFKLAHNLVI